MSKDKAAWHRIDDPKNPAPRKVDLLLHFPGRPPLVAGLFHGKWVSVDDVHPLTAPTHWQPLPEPPEDEE